MMLSFQPGQCRPQRRLSWIVIAAVSTLILLQYYYWQTSRYHVAKDTTSTNPNPGLNLPGSIDSTCATFAQAQDVLLVLKTGANEVHRKLPVHFDTILKCVPNYVIYSDFEEPIGSHHIFDVLSDVSDDIKIHHADFELYRRLQATKNQGPEARDDVFSEMSKIAGLEHNKAWDLDKWKFLPMIEKALQQKPDANWFVFVEADTYLVWSNLMKWLAKLDANEPYYVGGQAYFGSHLFAHGGAGFFVSRTAVQLLADRLTTHRQYYEQLTYENCCGDLILGIAFNEAGVHMTQAWPSIQGETPSSLDYTAKHWCFPVASYHHMSADEIRKMWQFEQQWMTTKPTEAFRHGDVFAKLVRPNLDQIIISWDNLSGTDDSGAEGEASSIEDCGARCYTTENCVQFSYEVGTTKCRLSGVIRLGHGQATRVLERKSGWMTQRIDEFKQENEPCQQDWFT